MFCNLYIYSRCSLIKSSILLLLTIWTKPKVETLILFFNWLTIFYVFIILFVYMLVAQLCLTLCDPKDCSPPGSSVHGILQARMLEWVAIPFSRASSWPRDQTCISSMAGRFLTVWDTREALYLFTYLINLFLYIIIILFYFLSGMCVLAELLQSHSLWPHEL